MPRMRGRSMRSGTELAQDIQLTDWSRAREHVKNLSNQFSGVQISCDICTRFGRYLYSTKQCWIINASTDNNRKYFISPEQNNRAFFIKKFKSIVATIFN